MQTDIRTGRIKQGIHLVRSSPISVQEEATSRSIWLERRSDFRRVHSDRGPCGQVGSHRWRGVSEDNKEIVSVTYRYIKTNKRRG